MYSFFPCRDFFAFETAAVIATASDKNLRASKLSIYGERSRTRVSFRKLLSRDFSRLLQWLAC